MSNIPKFIVLAEAVLRPDVCFPFFFAGEYCLSSMSSSSSPRPAHRL